MCVWSQMEAALFADHVIENSACEEPAGSRPLTPAPSLSHRPCQDSVSQAVT